jgi:hypothetical protein
MQFRRGCAGIRPRIEVSNGSYRLTTGDKPSSTGCASTASY